MVKAKSNKPEKAKKHTSHTKVMKQNHEKTKNQDANKIN